MPPKMKLYCSFQNAQRRKPYVIYDASILDQAERVAKAMRFETATGAADFLGMTNPAHLNNYSSHKAILEQKKFKSEKQGGKLFIIRKLPK